MNVERLAEAIAAVDLSIPPMNDREREHWRAVPAQLDHARAIIEEYDRLTFEAERLAAIKAAP